LWYQRDLGPRGDLIFQVLRHVPGRLVTRARRQLVSDAAWYRSAAWDYRHPIGIDEQLTSVYQLSDDGAITVIASPSGGRARVQPEPGDDA
jgi:hypothetical protein